MAQSKEDEIMDFLERRVFAPAETAPNATQAILSGIRMTRLRMRQRNAAGMVRYFWSAIIGTDRSKRFAKQMRQLGLARFEETIDEFRERFSDDWLRRGA